MSKKAQRVLPAILILALAAITCTMPSAVKAPVLSSDSIADTAVARAFTAQAGVVPSPTAVIATQCSPTITAGTDANVRTGPGTGYDIAGKIPAGGSALVAGRNDVSTWWYIQFAGGYGGYAWIAGSVVTSSCIPAVIQVVAAPPLPTAPPPTATPKGLFIQPGLQFELYKSPTPVLFQYLPNFEQIGP